MGGGGGNEENCRNANKTRRGRVSGFNAAHCFSENEHKRAASAPLAEDNANKCVQSGSFGSQRQMIIIHLGLPRLVQWTDRPGKYNPFAIFCSETDDSARGDPVVSLSDCLKNYFYFFRAADIQHRKRCSLLLIHLAFFFGFPWSST